MVFSLKRVTNIQDLGIGERFLVRWSDSEDLKSLVRAITGRPGRYEEDSMLPTDMWWRIPGGDPTKRYAVTSSSSSAGPGGTPTIIAKFDGGTSLAEREMSQTLINLFCACYVYNGIVAGENATTRLLNLYICVDQILVYYEACDGQRVAFGEDIVRIIQDTPGELGSEATRTLIGNAADGIAHLVWIFQRQLEPAKQAAGDMNTLESDITTNLSRLETAFPDWRSVVAEMDPIFHSRKWLESKIWESYAVDKQSTFVRYWAASVLSVHHASPADTVSLKECASCWAQVQTNMSDIVRDGQELVDTLTGVYNEHDPSARQEKAANDLIVFETLLADWYAKVDETILLIKDFHQTPSDKLNPMQHIFSEWLFPDWDWQLPR